MNLTQIVCVGLAGSVGAVARFVLDGVIRTRSSKTRSAKTRSAKSRSAKSRSARTRSASRVPVGTVTINLSGSLLLGFLTGLVVHHAAPSTLTLVAGTGFCGGYTTFSTASFETVRLVQQGATRAAIINGGGTVVGALAAAAIGLAVAAV